MFTVTQDFVVITVPSFGVVGAFSWSVFRVDVYSLSFYQKKKV